jgi:hypothetical protein
MTDVLDPETLFPPKPGGMVDTARKRAQAEADQLQAYNDSHNGSDVAPGAGYDAIRVRPEPPGTGTARTVTLSSANPFAQLLPRDATRRWAVVVAIDADVWLSYNQGTAQDLSGTSAAGSAFYLPAGVPIPVDSQAQLFVSPTTTATSTRVSVITGRDTAP